MGKMPNFKANVKGLFYANTEFSGIHQEYFFIHQDSLTSYYLYPVFQLINVILIFSPHTKFFKTRF